VNPVENSRNHHITRVSVKHRTKKTKIKPQTKTTLTEARPPPYRGSRKRENETIKNIGAIYGGV